MEEKIKTIDDFTKKLRDWYNRDHGQFKTLFNDAVKNVQPIPEGTGSDVIFDWRKADIDTLCDFFRKWYKWLPDVATGLMYIQKFSWLYYENDAGLKFVTQGIGLEMTKEFVELRGEFFDSPESKDLVLVWEKELGDQMDQFVIPEDNYSTFNEFFIREVKDGARPVDSLDDDSIVVAPADCVINMIVDDLIVDRSTMETKIPVKTVFLNVKELLYQSKYAAKFDGGTAVSCILMPNTYHRYHSPVSGTVVEANEDVAGEYFGIKDFPDLLNKGDVGYGYDYSVFEHFRRGYLVIKTNDYGYVGMVPVGLNTIASVIFKDKFKKVTSEDTPVPIQKGEEVGWFQYGGSLNILLFEKGRFLSLSLLQGRRIGVLK